MKKIFVKQSSSDLIEINETSQNTPIIVVNSISKEIVGILQRTASDSWYISNGTLPMTASYYTRSALIDSCTEYEFYINVKVEV